MKLSERIKTLMDNEMYGNWASDLIRHAETLEAKVAELERENERLRAGAEWVRTKQINVLNAQEDERLRGQEKHLEVELEKAAVKLRSMTYIADRMWELYHREVEHSKKLAAALASPPVR